MALNVSEADFQTAVMEKSKQTPVLVDFWAEWCGPCRMIGPVVEKLEQDPAYKDRFVLAKVNTEENPGLAQAFQISSIPAFKLFADGKVAGEFVGALPEPQVRQWLDQHLPDPEREALLAEAKKDPVAAARKVLAEKRTGEGPETVLWLGAMMLAGVPGVEEDLKAFLAAIPEMGSRFSDGRNGFMKFLQKDPSSEDLAHLRDVLSPGKEEAGLAAFLAKVEAAPADQRGQVKDDLLLAFQLLGNTGDLVNAYRRKLSAILF